MTAGYTHRTKGNTSTVAVDRELLRQFCPTPDTPTPTPSPTLTPTPINTPGRNITTPTSAPGLTATPDCKLSSFAQITYGNNQPLTIKNPSAWLYKNSKGTVSRFEPSSDGSYFQSRQNIVENFTNGTGGYRKG